MWADFSSSVTRSNEPEKLVWFELVNSDFIVRLPFVAVVAVTDRFIYLRLNVMISYPVVVIKRAASIKPTMAYTLKQHRSLHFL